MKFATDLKMPVSSFSPIGASPLSLLWSFGSLFSPSLPCRLNRALSWFILSTDNVITWTLSSSRQSLYLWSRAEYGGNFCNLWLPCWITETTVCRSIAKVWTEMESSGISEMSILEVESKAKERESVLCSGGHSIGHLFSGVNFWGRNCVRRARQRGGNCEASRILKRGFHALPVPEIYTSEYMSQPT